MTSEIAKEYSIVEPHMYNKTYKSIVDLESDIEINKNKLLSIINKYKNKYSISKEYTDYLLREINYHFVRSWAYHKKKNFKNLEIPTYIEDSLQSFLNDSLNFGSISRHSAIYSYVQAECNCVENLFPSKSEYAYLFDFINKNYKGINQNQLLLSILYEQIKITSNYSADKDFFQRYINYFYQHNTDADYRKFIDSLLKNSMNSSKLALDSINVVNLNDENENLKSINSFSDKYKIIIIDIWASWCIPCLAEIPASKRMQVLYQNKGIYFMYLSVDSDKKNWMNANHKFDLPSSQSYLVTEVGKNYLKNKIDLSSIPRYILISIDGKIIDDNMPKFSDPNFQKIIENNFNP